MAAAYGALPLVGARPLRARLESSEYRARRRRAFCAACARPVGMALRLPRRLGRPRRSESEKVKYVYDLILGRRTVCAGVPPEC